MFTGLIQALGQVRSLGDLLSINCHDDNANLILTNKLKASIFAGFSAIILSVCISAKPYFSDQYRVAPNKQNNLDFLDR